MRNKVEMLLLVILIVLLFLSNKLFNDFTIYSISGALIALYFFPIKPLVFKIIGNKERVISFFYNFAMSAAIVFTLIRNIVDYTGYITYILPASGIICFVFGVYYYITNNKQLFFLSKILVFLVCLSVFI